MRLRRSTLDGAEPPGGTLEVEPTGFDLSEGAEILSFDLANDFEATGSVSGRFESGDPIEFAEEGELVDWQPTT